MRGGVGQVGQAGQAGQVGQVNSLQGKFRVSGFSRRGAWLGMGKRHLRRCGQGVFRIFGPLQKGKDLGCR